MMARYIWRADITWQVIRLNRDGTEVIAEVVETEEQAKERAAKLDKRVRAGRRALVPKTKPPSARALTRNSDPNGKAASLTAVQAGCPSELWGGNRR
jgi:hypothetical protein